MDGTRPDALTDTQLDQELEAALGIEPSPEFVARVRTRIGGEPEPSPWRMALMFRRIPVDPISALAIVGVVLAVVVPQMLRPSSPSTQIARVSDRPVRVQVLPTEIDADVPRQQHQPEQPRRMPPQRARAESPALPGGARVRSFEDRILLAPSDREAFDRLLTVVSDQTIELVAPVLESTHAAADMLDAVVNVPALARPEGVSQ
jgi:hypothetical protein